MSALIDKYTRIPGDPGGATVTWESIHRAIFRRRCTGPDRTAHIFTSRWRCTFQKLWQLA
jgi:hypothetical protein